MCGVNKRLAKQLNRHRWDGRDHKFHLIIIMHSPFLQNIKVSWSGAAGWSGAVNEAGAVWLMLSVSGS